MKQNALLSKLLHSSIHILFFLTSWALLSWYYGDVLYIAQQNSFFSTESELMEFITSQSYGYLWWIGRALLQPFYYPAIGGFLTALLLTLISGLLRYVLRLSDRWSVIQFLPAIIWMAHGFYKGYDLYYQAETGKILGIPACILIILLLQTLFMRTFRKKSIRSAFQTEFSNRKRRIIDIAVLILIPVALIVWNENYRPYVRPTAHMQKALQQEDWEEMKKTAKECNVSARPIAAYYAIALMQTGEITQSLFDIEYNYMELFLHDRNGDADYGTAYYEADGNLHAGLINSAYRNAMERMTMDGPSALILKLLAETALLNGENKLCDKYLNILEYLPFEGEFVEKIRNMNRHPELAQNDARYARIMQLYPANDAFETLFRTPLFLGYNTTLLQGRSMAALNASLAACLYSKMMPDFLIRTEPLVGTTLPRNVQDALIMESAKNPRIGQLFTFDSFTQSKYDWFRKAAARYKQNRKEGAEQLKEQFLGFYPYYYHFGNIASERKEEKQNTTPSEKRVN